MYRKYKNTLTLFAGIFMAVVIISGCTKYFPEERENIGGDSQFTIDKLEPVLGRNTSYNNFYKGSTTFPTSFVIKNIRRRNGEPAPELESVLPVTVWKQAYTGQETSIAEIQAKQTIQNRPVLEINKTSGSITLWNTARSNFIRAVPDSGYLFDIELSNTGGRRYFRDFRLMPFRERPTEPSNRDMNSGQEIAAGVNTAILTNVVGDSTNRILSGQDVLVSIKKIEGAPTNKLTFRFLNKNGQLMNPALFGLTNWNTLVHGFNPVINSTGVTYDVLYPIPLVQVPTAFTTPDGTSARTVFAYQRVGFAGMIVTASIDFRFAIYEPGNWEVIFHFTTDNPRFTND